MKLSFHHIGVACHDLDLETRRLAVLGYAPEGPDFTDPIQGVSGRFLSGGGPRLELLTALGDGGVLTPWLNSGVKLYHLGYETTDLTGSLAHLKTERARVMVQPVEAVAFEKRKIAFLMLPNMLLTELISTT
jgi:methylmalonyl-CoA/ethylmalonyl-CoA epimerase